MRQMHILVYTGILLVLIMGFFLAGCTGNRPIATNPPLYQQTKLNAVDHWDNIADAVATHLNTTYQKRYDLIDKPVYVSRPNDRPFSVAFQSLLKTRMVRKGMQVSEKLEPDGLLLEFNVQAVVHEDSPGFFVSSLENLGIGILSVFSNKYGSASQHELLINSSLSYRNRYALHMSTPCYINDADWHLYVPSGMREADADTTRRIRVTGR